MKRIRDPACTGRDAERPDVRSHAERGNEDDAPVRIRRALLDPAAE